MHAFGRWLREHSLFTVTFALFVVFLAGMAVSGWGVFNDDRVTHGGSPIGFFAYLGTGAFGEAVFENWESEFLQMGAYVVLTIFLIQKGSSESKPPHGPVPQDEDPRRAEIGPKTPWPVRRGGVWLVVYENSLAILFFVLFGASVVLHAVTGAAAYSEEQLAHGLPPVGVWEFVGTSEFWFQSMQNWQSEFLAVALLVLASVYLRQRGSPESKPVAAPHAETGG